LEGPKELSPGRVGTPPSTAEGQGATGEGAPSKGRLAFRGTAGRVREVKMWGGVGRQGTGVGSRGGVGMEGKPRHLDQLLHTGDRGVGGGPPQRAHSNISNTSRPWGRRGPVAQEWEHGGERGTAHGGRWWKDRGRTALKRDHSGGRDSTAGVWDDTRDGGAPQQGKDGAPRASGGGGGEGRGPRKGGEQRGGLQSSN